MVATTSPSTPRRPTSSSHPSGSINSEVEASESCSSGLTRCLEVCESRRLPPYPYKPSDHDHWTLTGRLRPNKVYGGAPLSYPSLTPDETFAIRQSHRSQYPPKARNRPRPVGIVGQPLSLAVNPQIDIGSMESKTASSEDPERQKSLEKSEQLMLLGASFKFMDRKVASVKVTKEGDDQESRRDFMRAILEEAMDRVERERERLKEMGMRQVAPDRAERTNSLESSQIKPEDCESEEHDLNMAVRRLVEGWREEVERYERE